jgi:hypothetical protein
MRGRHCDERVAICGGDPVVRRDVDGVTGGGAGGISGRHWLDFFGAVG